MSFLGAKKKEQFTPLPDEIIIFLPSAHFGRKNLIAVEASLKDSFTNQYKTNLWN
jgi:hypothetical protein